MLVPHLSSMHHLILAVPFPRGLVNVVKGLLRGAVDLDDFQHARQIASGVEIDDAAAQRFGRSIRECFLVAACAVKRRSLLKVVGADRPMMETVRAARLLTARCRAVRSIRS
jgi:hypothetical protein